MAWRLLAVKTGGEPETFSLQSEDWREIEKAMREAADFGYNMFLVLWVDVDVEKVCFEG